MKTIYGTVKDLSDYVKSCGLPKYSILLRSIKTDLPLAAWVYDGYSGGAIITRRRPSLAGVTVGSDTLALKILLRSLESKK